MATDPVHGDEAASWGGWSWRAPWRGEHFRRCSYCGSIHPEDLAAEAAWQASWADWKYGWPHKFYIDIPNREPERKFIISAHRNNPDAVMGAPGAHRPMPDLMPGLSWVPANEVPPEVETGGWLRPGEIFADKYDVVGLGTRPNHHAKFYTAHLADPQLSDEAKALIEQRSGLRFHFHDGTVRWEAVTAPEGA